MEIVFADNIYIVLEEIRMEQQVNLLVKLVNLPDISLC